MKTPQEFWDALDTRAECWEWNGDWKCASAPYGIVQWRGRKWKAHRLAWTIINGSIPEGMHVLHKCDNPKCARPAHLFLGTHADNMRDRFAKGRHGALLKGAAWHAAHDGKHPAGDSHYLRLYPHKRRRGEQLPWTKLTARDVLRVRLAWAHNKRKYGLARELAAELRVDRTLIWHITTNRIWVHGPHVEAL